MIKRWNGFCAVVICSSTVLGCRGKPSKKNVENKIENNNTSAAPTAVQLRTSGDLSQATLAKRIRFQFKDGNQAGHTEEFFNEKGLLVTQVGFKISSEGPNEETSRSEFSYDQAGNQLTSTFVSKGYRVSSESTFNAAGHLLKLVNTSQTTQEDGTVASYTSSVSREYDADGRLTKTENQYPSYAESRINEWDGSGRIASTTFFENGVSVRQTNCTFDDKGRITRIESLLAPTENMPQEDPKRKEWSTTIDWDQNVIETTKPGRTDIELRKGFQMDVNDLINPTLFELSGTCRSLWTNISAA